VPSRKNSAENNTVVATADSNNNYKVLTSTKNGAASGEYKKKHFSLYSPNGSADCPIWQW